MSVCVWVCVCFGFTLTKGLSCWALILFQPCLKTSTKYTKISSKMRATLTTSCFFFCIFFLSVSMQSPYHVILLWWTSFPLISFSSPWFPDGDLSFRTLPHELKPLSQPINTRTHTHKGMRKQVFVPIN